MPGCNYVRCPNLRCNTWFCFHCALPAPTWQHFARKFFWFVCYINEILKRRYRFQKIFIRLLFRRAVQGRLGWCVEVDVRVALSPHHKRIHSVLPFADDFLFIYCNVSWFFKFLFSCLFQFVLPLFVSFSFPVLTLRACRKKQKPSDDRQSGDVCCVRIFVLTH